MDRTVWLAAAVIYLAAVNITAFILYGADKKKAKRGQWRIPGILNGVYAPNQEIPPRYAGGEYRLGGTTMIVSRGLTRHAYGIPRLFNRPELVVIDLLPAEKTDLQPRSSSDRDS